MTGKDGIGWESSELEPLGSQTENSMPTDIFFQQFGVCIMSISEGVPVLSNARMTDLAKSRNYTIMPQQCRRA